MGILLSAVCGYSQENQWSRQLQVLQESVLPGFGEVIIEQSDKKFVKKSGEVFWVYYNPASAPAVSKFMTDELPQFTSIEDNRLAFEPIRQGEEGEDTYRFQATLEGVPIFGARTNVFTKNGKVTIAMVHLPSQLPEVISWNITPENAILLATHYTGGEVFKWEAPESEHQLQVFKDDPTATYYPQPKSILYPKEHGLGVVSAYQFSVAVAEPHGDYRIIVGADGELLNLSAGVCTANTPGTANTSYSGNVSITTNQTNSGNFELTRVSSPSIEVLDCRNTKDINGGVEILDNDNVWGESLFLRQVTIELTTGSWIVNYGVGADIYFELIDSNSELIYTSGIKSPSLTSPIKYFMNINIEPGTYTLKVYNDNIFESGLFDEVSLTVTSQSDDYQSSGNQVTAIISVVSDIHPGIDAMYGLSKAVDFYDTQPLNHIGISSGITCLVNWGVREDNAYWHPDHDAMLIGNVVNDAGNFKSLATLDILSHELAHRVIEFSTSKLLYERESGALNESFADIIGVASERHLSSENSIYNLDWTVGEDKFAGTTICCMRSFSDPGSEGQPDTYGGAKWKNPNVSQPKKENDYGHVHTNSGVQNYWFYILAQDLGTDQIITPDGGSPIQTYGIGFDNALEIASKNMVNLFETAKYIDAYNGSLAQAAAKTSLGATEYNSVVNAWAAVGIPESGTSGFCAGLTELTTPNGIFNDGSISGNYQSNTNCSWLIQPPGATYIDLEFQIFQLHSSDYVNIYEGNSNTGTLIASYSGNTTPPATVSSTGAMYVEFITNSTFNSQGFFASYESDAPSSNSGTNQSGSALQCGEGTLLTSNSDLVLDGSGTDDYLNNLTCSWLISPAAATSITLHFLSFDLEPVNDVVNVYDGSDNQSTLLGSYSGTIMPDSIVSSGGQMFVEFNTNNDIVADGFTAFYTSTGDPLCSGQTVLTAASGSLDDGSGAGSYYNYSNCQWLIQPPGATSVTLTINELSLQYPSPDGLAIYDYIRVYDGPDTNSPILGTYTGEQIPTPITSTGGAMLVEFISDFFFTFDGWSATYTSSNSPTSCAGTTFLTSSSGTFEDGSGAGNYTGSADCRWLIQPSGATSIVLEFNSFETESGLDGIIVYAGNNTNAPVLGVYTGNNLPPSITANSSSILVRFVSNASNHFAGWEASYYANISSSGNGNNAIIGYEYWFDEDINNRVYTNVTYVNQYLLNLNLNTSFLNKGLHTINFRFKDSEGDWSSVVSDFFYKLPDGPSSTSKLVEWEYWFDDDYNNRVVTTVSPTTEQLTVNEDVDVSNLGRGYHLFHARFKDNRGVWSSVVTEPFHKRPHGNTTDVKLVEWEYWFDDDYLNKVSTTVSPVEQLTLNQDIDASNLGKGYHLFHARFKDNTGEWSSAITEPFYKKPNGSTTDVKIVEWEYWFDNDYTNRISETMTPTKQLTIDEQIDANSLGKGYHLFHARFKDNIGQWSSVVTQAFYKYNPSPGVSPNLITAYRYWFDRDIDNHSQVAVSPPVNLLNLSTAIDASSLTEGTHTISFQFLDTTNEWSSPVVDTFMVDFRTAAAFNSVPAVLCAPGPVTFTNTSVNADAYLWLFGDGNSSTLANPTHTYTAPGVYDVTLIAEDTSTGESDTITINEAVVFYPPFLNLSGLITDSEEQGAANYIISEAIITGSPTVDYHAGDYIKLDIGFEVNQGAILKVYLEGCADP